MVERACIGESVPALSSQSLVPVYCRIIVVYKLKPTSSMHFICNVKGWGGGGGMFCFVFIVGSHACFFLTVALIRPIMLTGC